jgi:hypothetical protein
MSHLYDNPKLTFGKIKDVFQKASRGELVGTEKTDGQNIMLSFDVRDNTARASRNKSHFKQGGLTPDELQLFFGGRGDLEHSFSDSFRAFEEMARRLPPEAQIQLFGPEANIYYNAEVQDPRTSNVINYDVATLTIHRKGHGEYEKETGNLVKPIPEDYAAYLESILNNAEDALEGSSYRVQVNAIKQLQNLSNDSALDEALIRLGKFMSAGALSDESTIGEYLVQSLEKDIDKAIPGINLEAKKLLMKRMFEEGYGTENKSRKVTQREIIKSLEDQELKDQIRPLIRAAAGIIKNLIYPLEDIVHDFSVEMLRNLESTFILDNPGELERQKDEVRKAIEAIESSGNEEAIRILQHQMRKLKNTENMTTPAEGFVFDYDGHTYKFTGNFAPVNQILGLFKYGREGIPPLQAIDADEILYEKLDYVVTSDKPFVALFPGKFKPPHSGHLGVIKQLASNHGVAKVIIMISPRTHAGITSEQSKEIWELFLKGTPMAPKVEVRIPNVVSPVGAIYDYIDEASSSLPVLLAVGQKDKDDGRYAAAIERGKTRTERLNLPPIDVVIDAIPPQAGGVCASDIRNAMGERSEESMKKVRECLPVHISPDDKAKIMKLMEPEVMPVAEAFRSSDLYGMIEKVLDQKILSEGSTRSFIPAWLIASGQINEQAKSPGWSPPGVPTGDTRFGTGKAPEPHQQGRGSAGWPQEEHTAGGIPADREGIARLGDRKSLEAGWEKEDEEKRKSGKGIPIDPHVPADEKTSIDEISAMGAGAVEGGAYGRNEDGTKRSKQGHPYDGFNAVAFNKKEKEKQKLGGDKEALIQEEEEENAPEQPKKWLSGLPYLDRKDIARTAPALRRAAPDSPELDDARKELAKIKLEEDHKDALIEDVMNYLVQVGV